MCHFYSFIIPLQTINTRQPPQATAKGIKQSANVNNPPLRLDILTTVPTIITCKGRNNEMWRARNVLLVSLVLLSQPEQQSMVANMSYSSVPESALMVHLTS